MPLNQILIRSLSGYAFVLSGLAVYFVFLARSGRRQTAAHTAAAFVFCYYLIGILTTTGIREFHAFAPRLSLVPFVGMFRGPDTAFNLLLFFPLGLFLPLLYRRFDRLLPVAAAGFVGSLSIELLQLFGMGTTDINDLITNTAGACLGFLVQAGLSRFLPAGWRRALRPAGASDLAELLFFSLYCLLIMVTVQPLTISRLFGLG